MIIRQIALLSAAERITFRELASVSAAIQKQVTRDFGPIWEIDATVDPFTSPADVPPGYWPVTVVDSLPNPDESGYHLDERGQPYAKVLWSSTWSLAASHEILEMLADPFGGQTTQGPSVKDPTEKVSYLVEICDPCESPDCAYHINPGVTGQDVLVSDFYTPSYFDPTPIPGKRYSFAGHITRPREVLNGGYLSWQTADGQIWQLFGPAEMGFYRHRGAGRLHRERTDSLARGLRSASLVTAAAGGCKLSRDPVTGNLDAKIGDTVNLSMNGTTGNARFLSVFYAGSSVAGAGTTASLTVKSGDNILRCIIDGVPGDTLDLKESPCGTLLDSVTFNPTNPLFHSQHIVGS